MGSVTFNSDNNQTYSDYDKVENSIAENKKSIDLFKTAIDFQTDQKKEVKNYKTTNNTTNYKRMMEMLSIWDQLEKLRHIPPPSISSPESMPPAHSKAISTEDKKQITKQESAELDKKENSKTKTTSQAKIQLENKKMRLESEYKKLADSLRKIKRSNATLIGFMEQLEDKKINKIEKQKIINNIVSICNKEIPKDPHSDNSIKLVFIRNYAQRELLELEFTPFYGANLPQISSTSSEEKNTAITINLLNNIRKEIKETNESKQINKALDLLDKFKNSKLQELLNEIHLKDNEIQSHRKKKIEVKQIINLESEIQNLRTKLMDEVLELCKQIEKFIPKSQYNKILENVRYTKIGLLEIRPNIGKIENQILTRNELSNARIRCLCGLLSKSTSKGTRSIEDKLDCVVAQLSDTKTKLGEACTELTVLHHIEKAWIDPLMQEIYTSKFSHYIASEIEREKASAMVENLLYIGEKLGLQRLKSRLTEEHLDIIDKMKKFAEHKVKKISFTEPKDQLNSDFVFQDLSGSQKTNYNVSIVKTAGDWHVTLKKKGGPAQIQTFRSYTDAAAWVHSELDKKFIEHIGDHYTLRELLQNTCLLDSLKDMLINTANNVGSTIKIPAETSGVSAAMLANIPPSAINIFSNIHEIINIAIILPSIFLAMEAGEIRKRRKVLLKKIENCSERLKYNTNKLHDLMSKYERIKLIKDSREQEFNLKALKRECKNLKVEEVEITTTAISTIVEHSSFFASTVMSLHQLVTHGSLEVTVANGASQAAAAAASSLSIISGICTLVGGGVRLGADSYRVHQNRRAKDELKSVFEELKMAKNSDGGPILSKEDNELLDDVRKMQSRLMKNSITSSSLGIGSDLSMMFVGSAWIAAGAGAACPPLAIAIPITAAIAIGVKLGSEKIVEEVSDKTQESLLLNDPKHSDIGIMNSLRNRVQREDEGAKLIEAKLIEGFYKMSKAEFLGITHDLDERFAELELVAKRTSPLTKQSIQKTSLSLKSTH